MDETRCNERVLDRGGWHSHQCSRKIWKDGKCKVHHPDSVAKRREKSEERYRNTPFMRTIAANEESKKTIADLRAQLAESNRELDEAVENLKVLGQQQMDDFKKHKAELVLYRKAVGPVKECVAMEESGIVIPSKVMETFRTCIRILGEAGNERD